jgi:pyruvate/2-oxoglutarate/acetoin dehydrogenase E1 component
MSALAEDVRTLVYSEALREGMEAAMTADERVYLMGLGVPDPKGIFGTTLGLQERFGASRVMDMPTAENGMTGVAIGSALVGMRPVMVHQRVDFVLLALDQIVNNAAKWHYMFGGRSSVPLVIRLIVGRGWGQGPQHSQALQATFAHFPGLKVVAPATPYDAKGMLIAAIEDDNPVIFFEHRWLHATFGPVPAEPYRVPLGRAHVARAGTDATIVTSSYMFVEAMRAAEALATQGISAEVVDLRTIRPLDRETIVASACRTGRVVVADGGWKSFGVAAEVVASIVDGAFASLERPPKRVTFPDAYTPTTPALSRLYYPTATTILNGVRELLDLAPLSEEDAGFASTLPRDVPNPSFRGPF